MNQAAIRQQRLGYREGRWLVLALVLHALLLLIPPAEERPRMLLERAKLAVRLISLAAPAVREPPPEAAAMTVEPAAIPDEHPAPPTAARPVPRPAHDPVPPIESPPGDEKMTMPDVSAARLIGLRDSVTQRVPLESAAENAGLRLGEPRPFERPGNWQPGTGAEALAPFGNVFNGKTVPADVEVVDRWLAADGSHNVVVETPAGLRVCGRALPWDPARPLVEHVMLWQVCGGDFARAFKFKPKAPLDRNFIIPVANDTTEP